MDSVKSQGKTHHSGVHNFLLFGLAGFSCHFQCSAPMFGKYPFYVLPPLSNCFLILGFNFLNFFLNKCFQLLR